MKNYMFRVAKAYAQALIVTVKIAAVVAAIFMAVALFEYNYNSSRSFSDPEFLVAYWPMMPIAPPAMFILITGIGSVIGLIYATDVVYRGADLPRVPTVNMWALALDRVFDQIIEANKK